MNSSRMLRVTLILGLLSLLLLQTAVSVITVERSREAVLGQTRETAERTANSVEGTINRALVQVDALLAGLPALLAPFLGPAGLDERGANELLRQLNSQNFVFRDVIVARPDGTPILSALAASRRRPLPIGPGQAMPDAGERSTGLMVSAPWRNPATGEWSVLLARSLTLPGFGRVIGVTEVPVSSLAILLSAGGQADGHRILISHAGVGVLGVLPLDEGRLGKPLAEAARPAGEVIAAARTTLYSNIAILVEIDLAAALAGWHQERERVAYASGAVGLLLVALMAALMFWLTLRDRAEAERQRWRMMLEDALNSMADGFVMFDKNDRLVICNESYRRMYEISAPFIREGAHFDDIIREGAKRGQYPQLKGDVEQFIAELRALRRSGVMAMERLLPGGRWVLITERPMRDGGTVGIRIDITALKTSMAELAQARDAAQKASAEKGMFLARMSHELRTPLNAVLGFAQVLLADQRLDETQRSQIQLIREAAAHLRDMVNTLLDLSKAEAGRLELRREAVQLAVMAETCARLIEPELTRKSITLGLHLDGKLPALVLGDALRLRQVLLNLLSNAAKFAPVGGKVELRLRAAANGRHWLIEVEDNGPGIPPEDRHLLFRDFSQLATAQRSESGAGLGLAITAQLVAAMGGTVRCIDGGLGGALFQVELPLEAVAEGTPASSAPPPAATGAATGGLHVMVADDIAVNRLLMRILLEQEGHRVTLASHGEEVLELLAADKPDLLLLDVYMPVLDGLETARRIRAAETPGQHLPILALTASALPEQVAACEAAGMDGHLAKPVSREELVAALARFGRPRNAPTSQEAVLDRAALASLQSTLGDRARDVTLALVAEARRGINALRRTAPEGGAALASHAHALLGPLRSLGAMALAQATEALERAARAGQPASAALQAWSEAAEALGPELDRLEGDMQADQAVA